MGSHDALPDAILELILLGLDSPLCLHRAASTCKRWRRIITSDAFATLHKRTHADAVAGSYYNRQPCFRPRFVPSPSAAAVDGRHFSLGFIPGSRSSNWRWRIMDSRGSLLLLRRHGFRSGRQDLIVCEPLTRRHVVIPPRTPDDGLLDGDSQRGDTVVLLDGDDSQRGDVSMSEFKILWLVENRIHGRFHASMFSSASSTWRVTSIDGLPVLLFIGIAAGRRRYWHDMRKKVFVLDQSAFKFSSFVLPDEEDWDPASIVYKVALTVGHDGEDRIAVAGGGTQGSSMKIFARVQEGGGGGGEAEWALEKTIQLSAAMLGLPRLGSLHFSCNLPVEAGKLKITVPSSPAPEPWRPSWLWFRFDMETMEAERLLERDVEYVRDFDKVYPCEFPWPWTSRACHDKT